MSTVGTLQPSFVQRPTPRSADMAQMLDDIERAQGTMAASRPASAPALAASVVASSELTPLESYHPVAHGHGARGEGVGHGLLGAHLALEALEASGAVGGALVGGAIGGGVVAVGLAALGVEHIKHGLHTHQREVVAEGVSSLLLSARSGLGAAAIGSEALIESHAVHGHLWHDASRLAHDTLAPLGMAHGLIDVGIGVHTIAKAHKEGKVLHGVQGALGVGMGAAMVAASAGAGLPALAVAGGCLAGRLVLRGVDEYRKALAS